MKKSNLIIYGLCILLVAISAVYFLNTSNESGISGQVTYDENKDIRIGYRAHLFYLPAYVAYKNGYFAEQGLNAQLVEFDSTNQLVDAVLSGDLDAAVGGVNTVVPLTVEGKAPGSIKIFATGVLEDDLDYLLVAADSDIKSVKDLEGKTISLHPGTASEKMIEAMLRKEGLLGKVQLIQTNPSQQLNALASGSVDAVFVLEPLATPAVDEGIARVLVRSPISKYYKQELIFETNVMSTEFIKRNPETAERIKAAVDKAVEFINNNEDVARKYYSEFTPVDDSLESKLAVGLYYPSYDIDESRLQETADFFFNTGVIDDPVNVSEMIMR